jgi:CubicO group peptidase (beta-lactamase class C family)
MKIAMRALAACLVFTAALVRAQPPLRPDKQDDPVSDAVDDYIKKAMSRQHIPGLSLVVTRDGKVIKAKGYGLASLELGVPARPETVYELASATKPFVATAIMLLVQDGKIGLEDKISKYLENAPEAWKDITVRHLLSHTSGIKDYLSDLRRDFPHDTSPEKFAQAVMREPLKFAPGEKWAYTNTGYVLLGMIVLKVSGKSYDAFLEERVFKPLGMSATRCDTPDEVVPGRAVGYLWAGPGGLRNAEYLKYLMMNHGDGGILSTAPDLARFDAALSTDRLLSAPNRSALWAPVKLNDGKTHGYGLGWFLEDVNGHKHVYHPGGCPGASTMISRYPDDKLSVIFLTNGGAAYAQGLDLGIAQRYIPGLVTHKAVKLDPAVLDSYTGYYNAYGHQVLKVTREGEVLVLDDGGRLANEFLPLSDTSFVAADADRGFVVRRTATGAVERMTLRLGSDEMPVQRIGPLFSALEPQAGADGALIRKVEAVLKALAAGGRAVEQVPDLAPQARKDYARGPVPEYGGIQSLALLGAQDVAGRGIERHGGKVSRVLYVRVRTEKAARNVLVYLTEDGLVTDEDVLRD